MKDLFDKWIHWLAVWRVWGPRCSEFELTCATCRHWAEHDWLFDVVDVDADETQAAHNE